MTFASDMRHRIQGRIAPVVLVLLAVTAGSCWAGTSDPIGIGGLIGAILIYLIVLIALATAAFRLRWAGIAAFAWLVIPPALVWHEVDWGASPERRYERERARANARYARQAEADKATYIAFCKERKQEMSRTAPAHKRSGVEDQVLLVRATESDHPSIPTFDADVVAQLLLSDPMRCQRMRLGFIEASPSATSDTSRRYPICTDSRVDATTAASANYELVLGEKMEARRAFIWSSSARIRDRQTNQTLASDTLYFLDKKSGVAECPKAEEQLAELIERVFARPR